MKKNLISTIVIVLFSLRNIEIYAQKTLCDNGNLSLNCGGANCTIPYPDISVVGSIRGRDDNYSVFIGGNFTVSGGAECEGKMFIYGNFVNNHNGNYNAGLAGVGSGVIPSDNTDYLTIGGNLVSPAGQAILLSGLYGTKGNARIKGTFLSSNFVIGSGTPIADPSLDLAAFDACFSNINTLSQCWKTAPSSSNGKFTNAYGTYTFTSTNGATGLYVFNLTTNLDPSYAGTIDFSNFPDNTTILINIDKPGSDDVITLNIGTFTGVSRALRQRIIFNFPDAQTVNLNGGSQFIGTVVLPSRTSTLNLNVAGLNGRVIAGGNVNQLMSGSEVHNYSFQGDLSSLTCRFNCVKPTAITFSKTAPVCTGSTPNNDGKITLIGATGADKVGISTLDALIYNGPVYASATAYSANKVVQSAIPNIGGKYILRLFNGSDACYKDTTILVPAVACNSLCTKPTYTKITVSSATCTGAIPNNDAKLFFESAGADKFSISTGATYTGVNYASALPVTSNTGIQTGISNPISSQQYTIRLFNGSDICYKDTTVILPKTICPLGSIGDFVWKDTNNNGIQDVGEKGVAAVKLFLLNASGTKIDSTITDPNGKYLFDSLLTGTYKVQIVTPSLPKGCTFSPQKNKGNDDSKDNDFDTTGTSQLVTIDTAKLPSDTLRNNPNIDAALYTPLGSIGDFVWKDTNNNGIQDVGEKGVAAVKLFLLNVSGTKIDSTITDPNGKYLFDSLLTGTYKVQIVTPSLPKGCTFSPQKNKGNDDSKDNDFDTAGTSQLVTIDTAKLPSDTLRNNPNVDAALYTPLGSIGDFVWKDTNNNGIQDVGEKGVAAVKLFLLNVSGTKIDSTITDPNGKYLFDSLASGQYRVSIDPYSIPKSCTISPLKHQGNSMTLDTDFDTKGFSYFVKIDTNKPSSDTLDVNTNIDLALIPIPVDLALTKEKLGNTCQYLAGDTATFKIKIFRNDTNDFSVTGITVKDSLATDFTIISSVVSQGTFNPLTGLWSNLTIALKDTATLTIQAKINVNFTGGLVCNDAWIQTSDSPDTNSTFGSKNIFDNSYARACVSVPLKICTQRNDKILLTASQGYNSYQWYVDGNIINGGTNSTYLAKSKGNYTVTINGMKPCWSNNCCPIIILEDCPCLANVCIPFVIRKSK